MERHIKNKIKQNDTRLGLKVGVLNNYKLLVHLLRKLYPIKNDAQQKQVYEHSTS
jgi:hypothetical protein